VVGTIVRPGLAVLEPITHQLGARPPPKSTTSPSRIFDRIGSIMSLGLVTTVPIADPTLESVNVPMWLVGKTQFVAMMDIRAFKGHDLFHPAEGPYLTRLSG
jgi:hypothetical protein